jgi:hypothetical protein
MANPALRLRKRSNDEWVGKCPRCLKPDHLGVNFKRGIFGCFRCNWSGHISQLESKYHLVKSQQIVLTGNTTPPKKDFNTQPLDPDHYAYVKERGITDDEIYAWKLCQTDELPFRILFPWPDWSYWAARAILANMEPKYRHPAEKKSDKLYGYWRIDPSKAVVIVEGPVDAVKTNNSVAVFGHHISDEQAKMLNVFRKKIVYFDPDVPPVEYDSIFKLKGEVLVVPRDRISDPGSQSRGANDVTIQRAVPLEEGSWA